MKNLKNYIIKYDYIREKRLNLRGKRWRGPRQVWREEKKKRNDEILI